MVRTTFSGREVIGVLTDFGYVPQQRQGSHVRLRYENEDTDEVRLVDVPMHDEIRIGTFTRLLTSAVRRIFGHGVRGSTSIVESVAIRLLIVSSVSVRRRRRISGF